MIIMLRINFIYYIPNFCSNWSTFVEITAEWKRVAFFMDHSIVNRPALWLLLTRLGIPDKIVRLFRVLYDNSVSCVRTGGTQHSSIDPRLTGGVVVVVCGMQLMIA